MIFENYILIGFIRLCLMVLVLYYMNSLIVRKPNTHTLLQFIVNEWFKYGSISLILLFVLIEIEIYSLINFVLIMSLIITIDFIGFRNLKNPIKHIHTLTNKLFHSIIVTIDEKKPLRNLFKLENTEEFTKDRVFIFWLILVLIGLAFTGRYFFYEYDTYLFSDLWVSDLSKIIAFDNQKWFVSEIIVDGELALANLYGKLTHVSPEVALQSLAILETVLLSLVLFWMVRKITKSDFFGPLIAFSSFIFFYAISPIEIHYLLQNQPILISLSFVIPAIVYTLKPELLGFKKLNYFISFTTAFIAIGLLDLFTLLILIPPFYLIIFLLFDKKKIIYQLISLGGYLFGTTIIMITYFIYCKIYLIDFQIFLQSSLISVDSFTYMPNIYIPFEQLLTYYQYGSFVVLLLLLILMWWKKESWKSSLVFVVYFNILIALYFVNITWIDNDLMRYALAVFIPILFGIATSTIVRIFFPIYRFAFNRKYMLFVFSGITSLFLVFYSQKEIFENITSTDSTPRLVLKAYGNIHQKYLPYTYAVVNDNVAQTISSNKHFFMNYADFLMNYIESDSIYHANRKNPKFAIENPDKVIPKSIVVFVYDENKKETNNIFSDQGDITFLIEEQFELLKKRGRPIELIFDSPFVKVYEIINEPKSSRIKDLIF